MAKYKVGDIVTWGGVSLSHKKAIIQITKIRDIHYNYTVLINPIKSKIDFQKGYKSEALINLCDREFKKVTNIKILDILYGNSNS